jgi:alkylation response protein AidB-like acyl-CoA dehydrogenase
MYLQLDDTECALQESFQRFLDINCPLEHVRDVERSGFSAHLWREINTHLAPVKTALPAEAGGDGASMSQLAVVMMEAGRHLAPVPLAEALAGARAVAPFASIISESVWLDIVSGERVVELGVRPIAPGSDMLYSSSACDLLLVLCDSQAVIINLDQRSDVLPNFGSLPIRRFRVHDPLHRLAGGPEAQALYLSAVDEWKVLMAAQLAGLARRALQIGVEYVKHRSAFGVPVGTFQSVAHKLADDVTNLDACDLLVFKAAWAQDHDKFKGRSLASMAFVWATEVARTISENSLHFHGGHGYTWDQDVQLFYRRAQAWPLLLGDVGGELHRLAAELYGVPTNV